MLWGKGKNGLFSIFFLIAIGIAIGYGVVKDPFSGVVVAGAVLVVSLAILSPWVLIATLLSFISFKVLWRSGGISPIELFYSLTFLLLLACWGISCVADIVINGKSRRVDSPLLAPLILLFITALFSAYLASTKGRSFTAWGSHLNIISFYAMYFVVVGYLRSLKDLNKILTVFLGVTAIAGVRGIFYRIFIDPTSMNIMGATIPKIAMASTASLIAVLMVIPFAALIKEKKAKNFYTFAIIFFGVLQVLSFVRSRWLGFIAGVTFLFFVMSPKEKKALLRYGLIALLVILVYIQICAIFPSEHFVFKLPHLIEKRFATIFKPQEELTVMTRFSEWSMATEKIKRHPIIGNGLGTQVSYISYDRYKRPTKSSPYLHNSYLFYYMNMGLLGFIAIFWLIVRFIKYGIKVYRTTKDRYYKAFALGSTAVFCAMSLSALMGAMLSLGTGTIVVGFLMGAVALIDKYAEKESQ